jgi:hypothetical protein
MPSSIARQAGSWLWPAGEGERAADHDRAALLGAPDVYQHAACVGRGRAAEEAGKGSSYPYRLDVICRRRPKEKRAATKK